MVPRVGVSAPVIRRKRLVFPAPFRPTIPQRSPEPTVKVTSRNSIVAPNSTAMSEKERMATPEYAAAGANPVMRRIRLDFRVRNLPER